jgi:hypothetical protein
MMGRLNRDQGQLFYCFNLEEAVPEDHQVHRIADNRRSHGRDKRGHDGGKRDSIISEHVSVRASIGNSVAFVMRGMSRGARLRWR